jgi:hypothetical protein
MDNVARDLVNRLIQMGCSITAIGDERYVLGEHDCPPPVRREVRQLLEEGASATSFNSEILAYLHELGRVEPVEYH